MRRQDFNGSPKTISGPNAVVTFTPSDIPSEQVTAFHIFSVATDGTGNNALNISRIRVKANGVTRFDVLLSQHANFLEKTYQSNVLLSTSFQCLSIPFYNPLLSDWDLADQYQFEPGAQASIELVYGAGAEAGAVYCGWTQTNVTPKYYTKFYGSQMNIADGAVNGRYNISEGGNILGLCIPALGLTRFKVVLNGDQWCNLPGSDYHPIAFSEQGLIGEAQRNLTAITPTAGGTPIVAPVNYFHILGDTHERGLPGGAGNSYIEMDSNGTGEAWAGTANELGIWASVALAES